MYSVTFDGSNSHRLTLAQSPSQSSATVLLRFVVTSFPPAGPTKVIWSMQDGTGKDLALSVSNIGGIDLGLWDGSTFFGNSGFYSLTATVWFDAAIVLSGATGTLWAKVASDTEFQLVGTTDISTAISPSAMWFGDHLATDKEFTGKIGARKIWSAPLHIGEITREAATMVPARTAGLWYWNPGSDSALSDLGVDWSGNGRDFTAVGSPTVANDDGGYASTPLQHPQNAAGAVGGTATFYALQPAPTGTLTAQWQVSTDGGGTWSNVSGATNAKRFTTPTIALSDRFERYRVNFTDSGGTTPTHDAVLEIPGVQSNSQGPRIKSSWPQNRRARGRRYSFDVARQVINPADETLSIESAMLRWWLTPIGPDTNTYTLTLSASASAAASAARKANASRAAASAAAAAVARAVNSRRTATVTATGTRTARTNATRSAGSTITATLARVRVALLTLSAAVAGAAVVQRAVQAIRSAASAASASRVLQARATRAASATAGATRQAVVQARRTAVATASATLTAIRTRLLTLAASTAAVGVAVRTTIKTQAAAVAAGATRRATVGAVRTAASAAVGTVAAIRAVLLTLSAATTAAGALVRQARLTWAAASTVAGSRAALVALVRSAATTAAGSRAATVAAVRAATTTAAATLARVRVALLTLAAGATVSATIQRAIAAQRAASQGVAASLAKLVRLTRSAAAVTAAVAVSRRMMAMTVTAAVAAGAVVGKAPRITRQATAMCAAAATRAVSISLRASLSLVASIVLLGSGLFVLGSRWVWRLPARARWASIWFRTRLAVQPVRAKAAVIWFRSRLAVQAARSRVWVCREGEMQTLEKRSSESLLYDFDFSELLAPAEVITSVSSISATPTGLTFGSTATNTTAIDYGDRVAPIATVVQARISGGAIPADVQAQDYIVRCKVVTNINPVVEGTVRLRVIDTPQP